MEVTLFDNQTIELIDTGVEDVTLRDGTVIKGAHAKKGVINVPLTAALRDALKSVGYSPKAGIKSGLQILLTIGFPDQSGPGPEGYLDACIANYEILTSDGQVRGGEMQISVSVSTIQENNLTYRVVIPAEPTHLFVVGKDEGRANSFKVNVRDRYGGYWRHELWTCCIKTLINCNVEAKWTATCMAKLILSSRPDTSYPYVSDPLVSIRRMLAEELYCDVTVIAKNGAEVKFHRSIMASQSSVFDSMFESGMKESQTGIVELRDLSEESVRALRDYLYVWDLEGAKGNSSVCFELLEAGHRYDIQSLEKSIEKTLLLKDPDWYSVDVALQLFLFVRGRGEEGLELKKKAVQVLNSKFIELQKLSSYQKLFKKNMDAAKDLMACFAGHFESQQT